MKYSTQIDEKCEQALHKTTCGDAFALEPKSKFVIFGGEYSSTLVDLNDLTKVVKQIPLDTPKKWFVKNYEWDPSCVHGNERYLQTRNKMIEIISTETSKTLITLNSHSQSINDAKWSPKNFNTIASTSNDNNLIIWNCKESNKPKLAISSVGEVDRLAWSKNKEHLLACSCNNDIRIYDIRKPNTAVKYITNAHTKKIYSLDWSAGQEEILLSSSRDRNIKLWNFNMINQKFMDSILHDFPCWKAKFTPYGLCFAVIPTCQSIYNPYQAKVQNMSPRSVTRHLNESNANMNEKNNPDDYDQIDTDKLISNSENHNSSFKQQQLNMTKIDPVISLVVCQIISLEESRIFKFLTNKFETILDFDFYTHNDRFNIVSWTSDQHLCVQSIDSSQLMTKDLERSSSAHNNNNNMKLREEEDASLAVNVSLKQGATNNNPIQPNTSNSSRKSSFSEFGGFGTPPTSRSILDRESFNLTDETSEFYRNSNSISIQHSTILRSTSSVDFFKNPKTFGAKFCGLPEQFVIYSNEGQFRLSQREKFDLASKKFRSKMKGATSNSSSKSQHNKQMAKRVQAKVYIHDISALISINKEFARSYLITDLNIKKLCEQNFITAIQLKRYDIAKIWELLKFITFNSVDTFSLNPDDGRPWSCSTFGRPLINNIIENCVKLNDIQTAAMIISKLKQHDMNMIPIASTVNRSSKKKLDNTRNSSFNQNFNSNSSICTKDDMTFSSSKVNDDSSDSELKLHLRNLGLLDPSRSSEFDSIIKFYCEILYRWSLFNKRIEMFEYVDEKPNDLDDKFECSKRCSKCSNTTNNAKCNKCNIYLTYCSICELPVNGLTTYCVICGHGGHYDHYIEWFKRHEDCASACGCRCIDYL